MWRAVAWHMRLKDPPLRTPSTALVPRPPCLAGPRRRMRPACPSLRLQLWVDVPGLWRNLSQVFVEMLMKQAFTFGELVDVCSPLVTAQQHTECKRLIRALMERVERQVCTARLLRRSVPQGGGGGLQRLKGEAAMAFRLAFLPQPP